MPLPLARAALVDNRRALARRARAHPVWAAALGVAALCAPLGATAAGRPLGRALGPALLDPVVARAFMAGLVLTTLAAGLSLGLVVSGAGVLGGQVGSAPASVLDRAAAVLTLPLGGVMAVAIAVGLPAGVPIVRAAPGGLASLPGVLLGLAGAVCAGGVLSACLRARSSSAPATCVAAGLSFGATLLPAFVAADALAGRTHPATAMLVAATGAALSLSAWALLVAAPHEDRARGGGSWPLPASRAGATAIAAGLLLLRRHDLRSALLGGMVIGVAGIGIARLGSAPPPAAVLLATTGAAVTLAPCGLAVGGAVRAAEHVWSLVPDRGTIAGVWLFASAVVTSAPAVAVCLVALGVEGGGSGGSVEIALALAAGAWGAAVLAGTIVPWRSAGLAEQAASLGACAVLWGSLSVLIALAGPRAADLGIPPAAIVGSILGIVVASAYHGLRRLVAEVA